MYFTNFEKGYYDLKNDGNEKLVTDLMTRVKVREKIVLPKESEIKKHKDYLTKSLKKNFF